MASSATNTPAASSKERALDEDRAEPSELACRDAAARISWQVGKGLTENMARLATDATLRDALTARYSSKS